MEWCTSRRQVVSLWEEELAQKVERWIQRNFCQLPKTKKGLMRSLAHLGPIKKTSCSPEELLQLLVSQHFLSIENSLLVWHLNEGLAPAAGAFLSFDQASFEKVALFLQAQQARNQLPKSEAGLVSILKPFCTQQCHISPEEIWAILEKKEYVQEQEGLCIWFGKHNCPASKRKNDEDEEEDDKTQQQRQKK